jgi:NADPH-dependent ferric siderophore reductase
MGLNPTAFPDTTLTLCDGTPYPAFAGIATAAPHDDIATTSSADATALDALRRYLADSLQRRASGLHIQPPWARGRCWSGAPAPGPSACSDWEQSH